MTIAMVGSGKVGTALGSWFAKTGVPVIFVSRNSAHAVAAAATAGYGARSMNIVAAVEEAEVLFLTLPFSAISTALEPIGEALAAKTLVDVTNPITVDHRALTIGHSDSGAEEIARLFPAANVVKSFNAVFAEVYAAQIAVLEGRALTIFYAGDDSQSKLRVSKLITKLGFDAVDAGPLENSRYLEPLSLLNINLGRVLGFGTQIGFSLLRQQKGTFK